MRRTSRFLEFCIVCCALLVSSVVCAQAWQEVPGGLRLVTSLPSAPYPYGKAPYQDDRVWIFVPDTWRDLGSWHAVVHIHGYHGRIEALVPAQDLEQQLRLSGRNAVLVVPQGPRDAKDMALGKLERPEGLRNLLHDVGQQLQAKGLQDHNRLESVVLSAHSGGYRGVANILRDPQVRVRAVHLFDALYSHVPVFAAYARQGGILRSSTTRRGGTMRQNQALAMTLARLGPGDSFSESALFHDLVTLGLVSLPHGQCVHGEDHFARWLAASTLPPSPLAPPQLRGAWVQGQEMQVRWVPDARQVLVQTSWNGQRWDTVDKASRYVDQSRVQSAPWVRLVARHGDGSLSPPSSVYAATGRRWLVVDAMDEGATYLSAHRAVASLLALGGVRASVVHRSFVSEHTDLIDDFEGVIWLGEEVERLSREEAVSRVR